MKRVVAIGLVLAVGLSATAQARFLGSAEDTSSLPVAFVFSEGLKRPKWLRVEFTASPVAPLDGSFTVSCTRGSRSRSVEIRGVAPGAYWRYPTLGKADECYLSAQASYKDFDQAGTISVAVYGESKRKKKRR